MEDKWCPTAHTCKWWVRVWNLESLTPQLEFFSFFFFNVWVFFLFYLFIFIERKGGRKRRRETSNSNVWFLLKHPMLGVWPTAEACALTGYRTDDPLVHRLALNPLSHTSQGQSLNSYEVNPTWRVVIKAMGKRNKRRESLTVLKQSLCILHRI